MIIRRNEDGTIDEITAEGTAHLEQLDDGLWWLSFNDGRRTVSVNLASASEIRCIEQENTDSTPTR